MTLQLDAYSQCDVVICNQSINISLDNNGSAAIYPSIIDEGSYNDCVFEIALYDRENMEELVPYADTIMLNCDHTGEVVFRMRDITTLNVCWSNGEIIDTQNVCISSADEIVEMDFKANYFQDRIYVELPYGLETQVHIYNVIGKRILSQQITTHHKSITLPSSVQRGTYIVSADINGFVRSKKIVVW